MKIYPTFYEKSFKKGTLKSKIEKMQVLRKNPYLISDVNDNFKTEFVRYYKANNYAQNTMQRELTFIKTFCRHARFLGLKEIAFPTDYTYFYEAKLLQNINDLFSYDGSTFTLNSLNLSGAAITTTGTISLSGNSSISDITLTTDVIDQTPANLTNVNINGTLAYNTNSPATIIYTGTTVDTVVNNGTGTVLIQRINFQI